MLYRFDVTVNKVQVMQVFDTVSYLTQLDLYQVAHYTDGGSFSPDLNGWNPISHPRSNIYALHPSTAKQDMASYQQMQRHKMEPHNYGRGNTKKHLHGITNRGPGPIQECFQIPETR